MFFDIALLWQPFGILKRRNAPRNASAKVLPSWSWVGWEGELDHRSWACGYDYVREVESEFCHTICWKKTSVKVVPTVEWSCSNPTQTDREQIRSPWQRLKKAKKHPGWKQHYDGTPAELYFRHKSTQLTKFEYPIPIRDPVIIPEPSAIKPFLHCRTRRAIFHFGEVVSPSISGGERPECISKTIYSSKDPKGEWAGIMRTNNPAQENAQLRGPCELVEISAGSALNREDESQYLEEWLHPSRLKAGGRLYEFYNVLWIEWTDGIAYRKGLGRVPKAIWEAVATENIPLTLG